MDWPSWLLLIVVAGATFLFYFIFHQREKEKQMDILERWKEWRRRIIRREQEQKGRKMWWKRK